MYQDWLKDYEKIKRKKCKYCEGDIWDRETLESNNGIEYTIGDKELLIAYWTPAFDGYNAECQWESEIPINFCPMCGRKLGD